METSETKLSSTYEKAPWIFKGRALYQLHLVKADTVRSIIPKELKLVEAFGYTLGGFFLANYVDSPAGAFDELVVIAGIVWNPPTSCAWAAKVLVSSQDACIHGRKAVGLPSQVAKFSKMITPVPVNRKSKFNRLLNTFGFGNLVPESRNYADVQVTETTNSNISDCCNINLASSFSEVKSDKAMGPEVRMHLPSFSGRTEYNANLLKYSCGIFCRLRPVKPATVRRTASSPAEEKEAENLSISVMLSKPILALEFSSLKMVVEAPVVVSSEENSCSFPAEVCPS